MKKVFLASSILAVLLMSGCGNPLSYTTQYKVGKKKVIVAYEEPAKKYNCKKVKEGTEYDPDVVNLFSTVRLGPSVLEAQELGNAHFSQEAAKAGANYVDREYYRESNWIGVYGASSATGATYYKCKTLPKPKFIKKLQLAEIN